MTNYALIEDGIVIGIMIGNGGYPDALIAPPGVAIGWSYVDGQFTPPPSEETANLSDFRRAIAFSAPFQRFYGAALSAYPPISFLPAAILTADPHFPSIAAIWNQALKVSAFQFSLEEIQELNALANQFGLPLQWQEDGSLNG